MGFDSFETKDNQLGFTLLELLVTTAIVGILASMAAAEFAQFRKKAYLVELVSFTRDFKMAYESRAEGYDITAGGIIYSRIYGASSINKNYLPGFYLSDRVHGYGISLVADSLVLFSSMHCQADIGVHVQYTASSGWSDMTIYDPPGGMPYTAMCN